MRRLIARVFSIPVWFPLSLHLLTLLVSLCVWEVLAGNQAYAGVNQWTSNQPGGATVLSFAINPVHPSTLYAGTSGDVFKSIDGGASWSASNTGLPSNFGIYALVIDPQTPNTLYAGMGGGGVYKSTDGSASWNASTTGLPTIVLALAINPQTPSTLYAGTLSSGVFQRVF